MGWAQMATCTGSVFLCREGWWTWDLAVRCSPGLLALEKRSGEKNNCGLGFRVGSFVTASRQMSDSQNYQPLGHVSGGHDFSDRRLKNL